MEKNYEKNGDVGFDGFNITPSEVIKLIDKNTSAIMPVHCYGFPCDVEGFDKISKDTGIPIIYDAAHAFGVLQNGQPIWFGYVTLKQMKPVLPPFHLLSEDRLEKFWETLNSKLPF